MAEPLEESLVRETEAEKCEQEQQLRATLLGVPRVFHRRRPQAWVEPQGPADRQQPELEPPHETQLEKPEQSWQTRSLLQDLLRDPGQHDAEPSSSSQPVAPWWAPKPVTREEGYLSAEWQRLASIMYPPELTGAQEPGLDEHLERHYSRHPARPPMYKDTKRDQVSARLNPHPARSDWQRSFANRSRKGSMTPRLDSRSAACRPDSKQSARSSKGSGAAAGYDVSARLHSTATYSSELRRRSTTPRPDSAARQERPESQSSRRPSKEVAARLVSSGTFTSNLRFIETFLPPTTPRLELWAVTGKLEEPELRFKGNKPKKAAEFAERYRERRSNSAR